eukprot:SAG22_NODE_4917_length_1133_cov_1.596712_1_plen_119_part_10
MHSCSSVATDVSTSSWPVVLVNNEHSFKPGVNVVTDVGLRNLSPPPRLTMTHSLSAMRPRSSPWLRARFYLASASETVWLPRNHARNLSKAEHVVTNDACMRHLTDCKAPFSDGQSPLC